MLAQYLLQASRGMDKERPSAATGWTDGDTLAFASAGKCQT
jgi:hypothetical protein